MAFAVYAIRLRWGPSSLPEELKPENVVVDKEGWETKASDKKERGSKKSSNGQGDRDEKPEG